MVSTSSSSHESLVDYAELLEEALHEGVAPRNSKRQRTASPAPAAPPPAAAAPGGPAPAAPPAVAAPPPPPAVCPPHPGFLHGLCIRCCAQKDTPDGELAPDGGLAHIPLSYITPGLEVSAAEAWRLRGDEVARALAARKLLLVLDLDHTLLNSARTGEIDGASLGILHGMTRTETLRPGGPQLYPLPYCSLWTKLRPGARELLHTGAALCEPIVYTMGDRGYAAEMGRLLDPGGALLTRGRLIAASDSATAGQKDLDVVLGGERMALILDDTPGVWRRHARNLVVAQRYHFFPSSAVAAGLPPSESWLARGSDEETDTGLLSHILRLVSRVHARFFADEDANPGDGDVRVCLAVERRRVLSGVRIAFSAVIPSAEADPARHPLWRLATELGASVAPDVGLGVTHLVCAKRGTHKHVAAMAGAPPEAAQPGGAGGGGGGGGGGGEGRAVLCVSPAWLSACGARWARANEAAYPVPP